MLDVQWYTVANRIDSIILNVSWMNDYLVSASSIKAKDEKYEIDVSQKNMLQTYT